MRISSIVSVLACAVLASTAQAGRIAVPASNVEGQMRGVKSQYLLRPSEITPEALFGPELRPDLDSFGQGRVGDCYALAAAKAYANPASKHYDETIETLKAVFLNADGTLRRSEAGTPQARFFRADRKTGVLEPVLVEYDGKVPMRNGKPVYAREAYANGQAWGPLFEVVYTKLREQDRSETGKRGYARVGKGGNGDEVMRALTGKRAVSFEITPDNVDASLARAKAALARGDVVTTGTSSIRGMKAALEQEIAAGRLDKRSLRLKLEDHELIVSDHEYGLLATSRKGVTTANPWNKDPAGRHGKRGVGFVKRSLYPVFYNQMAIGKGTPKDRRPRG